MINYHMNGSSIRGTKDGTIFDFYVEFIRDHLEDRYLALTIYNDIYYSEAVDLIDSEYYWGIN